LIFPVPLQDQVAAHKQGNPMRALVVFLLWAILLVLCWPLALVLLILWPILWLLSIPFRIVGSLMEGILALIKAIFMLPARLLGYRPTPPTP